MFALRMISIFQLNNSQSSCLSFLQYAKGSEWIKSVIAVACFDRRASQVRASGPES